MTQSIEKTAEALESRMRMPSSGRRSAETGWRLASKHVRLLRESAGKPIREILALVGIVSGSSPSATDAQRIDGGDAVSDLATGKTAVRSLMRFTSSFRRSANLEALKAVFGTCGFSRLPSGAGKPPTPWSIWATRLAICASQRGHGCALADL